MEEFLEPYISQNSKSPFLLLYDFIKNFFYADHPCSYKTIRLKCNCVCSPALMLHVDTMCFFPLRVLEKVSCPVGSPFFLLAFSFDSLVIPFQNYHKISPQGKGIKLVPA